MEDNLSSTTPKQESSRLNFLLVILVVAASLLLLLPILENIGPHPDEHQFYYNAWSIMSGKQLQNFLHVAVTEYALTGFLLFANLLTKSGVNYPQGDPSWATYFYGRVFGTLLYLLTFVVAALVIQKGRREVRPRVVFFSVLYFGSIGIFERFLRVNSDSMSIFVALNYFLLSLWLHQQRAQTYKFLVLDTVFVFLSSFTNLKALYMTLPILVINTFASFLNYDRDSDGSGFRLPRLYRFLVHSGFLVSLCILLWAYLVPRPIAEPKHFWYQIKNAIVWGTGSDFEYPNQAHRSASVYVYDFFVEYLGLSQMIVLVVLFWLAVRLGSRDLIKKLLWDFLRQFNWERVKSGNLYASTELILLLIFLVYFVGVGRTVIHWSRWGAPLGVFGLMILSPVLEKVYLFFCERTTWGLRRRLALYSLLFLGAWSLRAILFIDLKHADYPRSGGVALALQDTNRFLKEKGISAEDAYKKVAWFTGYTGNVSNLSLEKLVEPDFKDVDYIFWPQWNSGLLHATGNVDRSTHNQKAFVEKYAKNVSFRFPTLLSYYTFATKRFAWRYLRVPYDAEIESLIETEYAVVELKDMPKTVSLDYEVPFSDLGHYYSLYSLTFNIKNLPESYMFPPCASNPDVAEASSGIQVEEVPELRGGRTAGLYCHSLWFRVALRGKYTIRVEGLPDDPKNTQKIVSTQKFKWDPKMKTANLEFKDTIISVAFGVATKEKNIPRLKFIVSYDLEPK